MSVLLAIVVTASLNAQKLTIKGSDTCLPLVQKEVEGYSKKNPNSSITVIGGGSGVGIAGLIDGSVSVAMSSRSIKMEEKQKLMDGGKTLKSATMGFDALAVVVNPANKVSQLTRQQLEDIFTGKVTNWKEVGGDDMKIVVYSRESSSGTYEFMKEHVMAKKNYAATVLSAPATGAIIQSVSQTKGAIGYVGLAYVEKNVKALSVSFDGKTFVKPSVDNAKNQTYPITRPLYYYYVSTVEADLKPYLDFALSAEGQKIVKEVGYVPVK